MSLYDIGAGTDDVTRMRAAADVYRKSGDVSRARALDAAADRKEGTAQDARLHKTKQRIARRKTGWGVNVPGGVIAAGLGVIGIGLVLGKGRR